MLAGNEFMEHLGALAAQAYMNNSPWFQQQERQERERRAHRLAAQWRLALEEVVRRARALPPPRPSFARATIRIIHPPTGADHYEVRNVTRAAAAAPQTPEVIVHDHSLVLEILATMLVGDTAHIGEVIVTVPIPPQ